MTITNTTVVDTNSKTIIKSIGIKNEVDQIMIDAEKLTAVRRCRSLKLATLNSIKSKSEVNLDKLLMSYSMLN